MTVLKGRHISVRFGKTPILRDVSFSLNAGEWVAVVGPNGAGKTTLLRTVAGLIPYSGQVILQERPLKEWSSRERARRLAFVRQNQEISFGFTVMEFVLLGRSPHRGWLEAFNPEDVQIAERVLESVALSGYEGRRLSELSGGEYQRVRLAQVLAQDPEVLLLDEPTTHLDIHHQLDLLVRVRELANEGRTILSAIHDLPLAARFADRILVLHDGNLVADGKPKEILTPDLIRDVFRVDAHVPDDYPERLHYLSAL